MYLPAIGGLGARTSGHGEPPDLELASVSGGERLGLSSCEKFRHSNQSARDAAVRASSHFYARRSKFDCGRGSDDADARIKSGARYHEREERHSDVARSPSGSGHYRARQGNQKVNVVEFVVTSR